MDKKIFFSLAFAILVLSDMTAYAYTGVGQVSQREVDMWMDDDAYVTNYVGKAKKPTKRIKKMVEEYVGPDGVPGRRPEEIQYKYDEKGNLVKLIQLDYTTEIPTKWVTKYKYDSDGYLTKKERYSYDGSLIDSGQYTRDEKGRVTEITYGNKSGNTSAIKYFYGKKNIKIDLGEGGVKTYKLDKNGNIIYQSINTNDTKTWYTYVEKGRLIHKKESLSTGIFTEDITYDSDGYLSTVIRDINLSDGSVVRREYEYEAIPLGK